MTKSQELLGNTGQPPAVAPVVVVAVDVHLALAAPTVERGEAVGVTILPLTAVGALICESRIFLVSLGLGIGVGLEATALEGFVMIRFRS